MIDLTAVNLAISMLQRASFTVRKSTGGGYVDGIYVKGTETSIDMTGCIHNVKGSDLKEMPEAQHWTDMHWLYTVGEINGEKGIERTDEIDYSGKTYKVVKVHDRKEGAYYKTLIGVKDARENNVQSS